VRCKENLFLSESGQVLEWLPREVVELPTLAVFNGHLDEELRDTVLCAGVVLVIGGQLD